MARSAATLVVQGAWRHYRVALLRHAFAAAISGFVLETKNRVAWFVGVCAERWKCLAIAAPISTDRVRRLAWCTIVVFFSFCTDGGKANVTALKCAKQCNGLPFKSKVFFAGFASVAITSASLQISLDRIQLIFVQAAASQHADGLCFFHASSDRYLLEAHRTQLAEKAAELLAKKNAAATKLQAVLRGVMGRGRAAHEAANQRGVCAVIMLQVRQLRICCCDVHIFDGFGFEFA